MIHRGRHLTFGEDDLRQLGAELKRIVDGLESQYSAMMDSIKVQWSRYEAEKATTRKTFPFDNASNIIIPLVRIHADATVARYLLLIKPEAKKIWVGKSENDDFVKTGLLKEVPAFLNWGAVSDFDLPAALPDWVQETVVVGSGVIGLDWERKTVNVLGGDGKSVSEVVLREGPVVRNISREDILWDINYPVWEAPVVVERKLLTWQDIVLYANESWDWDQVQKFKKQTTVGGDVREDKDSRSGKDSTAGPTDYSLYDIRRIYIDWPVVSGSIGVNPPEEMEEGDVLSTIVVDMHMDSGVVADVTAAPYAIAGKPFYSALMKKRAGSHSSVGLGELLGDLQEAASTFFNQSNDAVTKANCTEGVTSNHRLADAERKVNRFTLVDDVEQVVEFGKNKNILPDIALLNQAVIFAERLTGINDPGLGRETRMGGHPATATTTLQLLQEGKKLDITAVNSFRAAMRQLGRDVALLYQQLEMDQKKVLRAVGMKDGQKILAWLRGPSALGMMEFDLSSVSESMNPQLEQQKAGAIFQFTANYYALANQYLTVAANPQAPPALASAMLKGLLALQRSYEKVLDNADIDDTTDYLLNLNQIAVDVTQQRARAAQAAAGQRGPNGAQANVGGQAPGTPPVVGSGM